MEVNHKETDKRQGGGEILQGSHENLQGHGIEFRRCGEPLSCQGGPGKKILFEIGYSEELLSRNQELKEDKNIIIGATAFPVYGYARAPLDIDFLLNLQLRMQSMG